MKNKDYVGQSNKRKKPAPKPQQVSRPPFPLVRFIVVMSLVAGFGYFLYKITTNNPNAPQVTTTPKSVKESSKPKERVLPPAPNDEEWQFIEELENKQVDVTTDTLEAKGPFLMQCASFRNESDAHSLKAKIAFSGFESQVRAAKGTTGLWHKVILGPFERKRDAEKTRHILKRNNINGCAIWNWNLD